jgi:excinuclease ABC subunit C
VGKAVSLRNRVRSYFQKSANLTIKTHRLVQAVRDLEYIVVESELEALVLECNLIKKHQPHYNVRLRDDKQYPYLCVTTSEPFPRLILTRRVRQDGNKYFGPYSGSRAVYATMDILKRIFPIVSCGKPFTGRKVQAPCLYYHLGQCLAPCAGLAEKDEYQKAVKDVVSFLAGQPERIVRDLRVLMQQAAEGLQFERAGRLRDQILAVEEVMARQKVISGDKLDQDVVAVVGDEGGKCVQMFYIRGGKLIGQNSFMLEGTGIDEPEESSASPLKGDLDGSGIPNSALRGIGGDRVAVQEFVKQYYQNAAYVPREILLPCDFDEVNIVQQWLRQKRGAKVEITVPSRGGKKRLVEMAAENATHAMEQLKAGMRARLDNVEAALGGLADDLGLEAPPRRIECYDISNFGAEHFVGSLVVCTDGQMDKLEYRRFKIKHHEDKPDDFAMMREIISRRLAEGKAGNPKFSKMPDLIIVDGGKGQLSSGIAAIEAAGFRVQGQEALTKAGGRETGEPAAELELSTLISQVSTLPIAGLAKRFEHLYIPGEPDPVILPRASQSLYLIQRIRDEAHRFANAYRITLQSKKQTRSALDNVPGIGPTRRKALLKHFGSVEKIRCASLDEITAAPKMTRAAAETLFAWVQQSR